MAFPEQIKKKTIELRVGRSAGAILQALVRAFPDEDLPDERTIRRWIKTKSQATLISEKLESHFQYIAKVAQALLGNDLDTVMKDTILGDGTTIDKYRIINSKTGKEVLITHEELVKLLKHNANSVPFPVDSDDFECFINHFAAEYPEIDSIGWDNLIEENPYRLIEILRGLANKKTFKGKCPICRDL